MFHVDCIVKNKGVLLHDLLLPGKLKPFFWLTLKKGCLHGDKGLNGWWCGGAKVVFKDSQSVTVIRS